MPNKTTNHRLLILSKDHKFYRKIIEEAQLPVLSISADEEPGRLLENGIEYDLLFGEPSRAARVLNQLPHIKWVQSTWAGVEPLFSPGLRRDYVLTNARNVYGGMMSEYVFGYLLMIERQIIARWNSQRDGVWDARPHGALKGKRIGLLGVGTIGAQLAKTAHHFGMQVYGYTRQSETCTEVDRYFHSGKIIEFTETLDYMVCTLPGTPATKRIINEIVLSSLPHHAWLINVGRGSIIDETALTNALTNGVIGGAVLDVFDEEPLPKEHPFWKTPNTFITFHTAAINHPPDIANLFIENYKLLIDDKPLLNQVDFDQHY